MFIYENQIFTRHQFNQPVVLFLHAFPLNSNMWDDQLEALAAENIPAVALDFPGFGKSQPWNFSPSIEDYGNVAYRIMRDCRAEGAIVVGLSMGGYVALSLLKNHPEMLRGLVLANTKATADTEEIRQKRFDSIKQILDARSLDALIESHLEKFFTEQTRRENPQLLQRARALMQQGSVEGVIHALQAMAHRPDGRQYLKNATYPALVIAGANDSLTTLEDARQIVENLPDGELKIIENAAHLSNMEAAPIFSKFLKEYVDTILAL